MRAYGWAVVGAVLAVAGLVMVLRYGVPGSASFGWFAYSPLQDDSGQAIVAELERRTDLMWIGLLVMVTGLLVLAAGIGYRVGVARGLARRA